MTVLIFFMVMTLLVLFAGIVVMASGNKTSKKYSNKLMIARVMLQGLALVALVSMFVFS